MRSIAVRLLLGEPTTTELRVFTGLDEISVGIDHIHGSGNANRAALRIDKDLWIFHALQPGFNRGNRAVIANEMGDEASTLS